MQENQVIPNPNPPVFRENRNSKRGKSAVIIISGLILLSILVTGAYYLGRKSTNFSSGTTPTPGLTIPTFSVNQSPTITPTTIPSATISATTTPTPNVKTTILSSISKLDGFRSSSSSGNSSLEIRAGRNSNLVTRGFVSFDLTDLPQGIDISEATLRLYQAEVVGNPYSIGGQLKIDHLNYGDSLDSEDYGQTALSSSFATLASNKTIEWKDIDVTNYLKDDLATGRSRSQFRIHFQTEITGGDEIGDFTYFESADNSMATGNTPQLVIKYY